MAYAMTVHTPLGDEKFVLNLPVGDDCGSAHMFKGSFDFTEFRKVNETYFLSVIHLYLSTVGYVSSVLLLKIC